MIVHQLAKKIIPILIRKLIFQLPALKKLDALVSYMEDDNDLDIKVKELEVKINELEKKCQDSVTKVKKGF